MIYDRIVIRYGELAIKGKNKRIFIDRTIRTIKKKCEKLENLTYDKQFDRLYIILNGEDHNRVIEGLNKVTGLYSYSLAAKCELDLEAIKDLSLEVVKKEVTQNVTFKVNTNRSFKKFPIQSMEVSKEVSRHVLRNTPNLTVDVRNPEVTLTIDIRSDGVYIMLNEIKGLGGLPIGIDGKGMLMISGGIDSPVAWFLMQKRGLHLEAIHFASPPFTNIKSKQKVVDLLEKIAQFHPDSKLKLHVVPFTNLQKAIYEHCPSSYGITIMRRMMYRITEAVARKNKAFVIVNGESLGQVASQTIDSMHAINNVTHYPVLRPLVAMDKQDIITISRKLDTYDISIRPFEDCCTIFVPDNPVTKPDLRKIRHYEQGFDFQPLMDEAIDNIEEIIIEEGKKLNLVMDEDTTQLF